MTGRGIVRRQQTGWLLAGLVLLGGIGGPRAAAGQATEPDPFYTGLMRDGRTSLARGDAAGAVKDLRVACFGLLDSPALLVECRIRLGLAAAALGDKDAFLESFGKIEEVEEKFGSYSAAAVTPEERRAFENKVAEWVAPEVLKTIPVFAPLLTRKHEVDLASLTPRERKKELERRAAAEKKAAADKKAADKKAADEKRAADRKAAADKKAADEKAAADKKAADAKAAASRKPPAAAGAAPAKPATPKPEKVAARPAAKGTETAKPAASTSRETKKKPASEPAKPAASGATPTTTAAGAPSAPLAPTPEKERAAAAAKLPAADAAAVADVRKSLASATRREELDGALSKIRPIADRNPADGDLQLLVGEIAYRAGQWDTGVTYFRRQDPGGPADPTLRFYFAVCLYESGNRVSAARVAGSGLERLPRTPFVDSYLQKILNSGQ
ncbi:MAG: tetratricopeptide repeat protein [Thermoanaerobaculia bacterium]